MFYNDMMVLDMERRKWFPLRVKEKKSGGGGGGRRRRKPKDGISKNSADQEEADYEEEQDQENDEGDNDNDDSSGSEFVEEDDQALEGNQHSGWDIDMLRANMFAFIDGDGNIVYEKIIADDEEKKEREDGDDDDDEEKEEEKEEGEVKQGEEEGNDESKVEKDVADEKIESVNESATAVEHTKPGIQKLFNPMKITSSSVMALNPETNAPEAVARTEPLPRINTSMLVRGNTLYLFGGILEVGDREVTLDDMWALDLRKREKWECLWPGTMHKQVWRGAIHDDDDSYISTGKEDNSDEEEEEEDDEDDGDDDGGNQDDEGGEVEVTSRKKPSTKSKRSGIRQEMAELNEKFDLSDPNRVPESGEALADFYARTSEYWNAEAAKQASGTNQEFSNKELKREGFKLAKDRYDELRPVLDRLAELDLNQKSAEKDQPSFKGEKKAEKSKKSSRR